MYAEDLVEAVWRPAGTAAAMGPRRLSEEGLHTARTTLNPTEELIDLAWLWEAVEVNLITYTN